MWSRRQLLSAAPGLVLMGCTRKSAVRSPRDVSRLVDASPQTDGAGVSLHRALGARALSMLDPFLLLDEIRSDDPNAYIAGFPDHPHRGFETVSYMIDGAMEHRDSEGNHGRLGPGSAQWMTAGHGIVHSEMPQQERGLLWGFQIWVNLPAARKMIRPRYQDIDPRRIPEVEEQDARVRVVAGEAFGRTGPVQGIDVQPLFVDVALGARGRVDIPVSSGHTALAYVTAGAVHVGPRGVEVAERQLAVLEKGDAVRLSTGPGGSARVLLLAARPLGEPVARRGPFVMNTQDEIARAIEDYQSGMLTRM